MLKKYGAYTALLLILTAASMSFAQRARTLSDDAAKPSPNTPPPAPAPETVKAKYEGGIFGHPNKKEGTLTLDAVNNRLVFRDGKNKELFSIPYGSITGAYGDTHSVRPAAATVASHVPFFGIPAGFIKTKVRYLTLQYDDPDSKASGVTSFRLENKDLLESVLYSLATKAELTRRGDIYIKKRG